MPSPTSALATLRPDLGGSMEEFNLEADRKGFIGHDVLPVFETQEQAGAFGMIPIEQLLQKRTTQRSPGGGYSRGSFTFTPATYACVEHGAEEPVDDRESEMYAEYFDAEVVSAARAQDVVLRNAEMRIAAAVFNSSTFTSQTTTVGTEWSTVASAVPMTNVEVAVQAVWDRTGLWPNVLIVNRKVFRNLRRCAQIIDAVKAQNFMDVRAGNINASHLATVFDLERVLVAGSPKNTADVGQTVSISPIWSDEYAMVTRVAMTNDIREPCIGRTFHWAADGSQIGATMESYRDERIRGDVIRARHDVHEKMLHTEAAQLLDNITA